MPIRQNVYFESDVYGPPQAPHPRISRRGLGGFAYYQDEPVSYIITPTELKPFLNIQQETDAETEEARQHLTTDARWLLPGRTLGLYRGVSRDPSIPIPDRRSGMMMSATPRYGRNDTSPGHSAMSGGGRTLAGAVEPVRRFSGRGGPRGSY